MIFRLKNTLSTAADICAKLRGNKTSIKRQITQQQKRAYGRTAPLTQKEVAQRRYTNDDEKRIDYYLGDIEKSNARLNSEPLNLSPFPELQLTHYHEVFQAAVSGQMRTGYSLPLLNLFNLLPDEYKKKSFLYWPGDRTEKNPQPGAIAKARPRDNSAVTLLNLDPVRLWELIKLVPENDIDYRQKKNMAVWRGAATGRQRVEGARIDLVNMLHAKTHAFDVGFSRTRFQELNHATKGMMMLKEQLQYKFLICLEGNDIASGLKWMLHSNSVVMMPRPTVNSWLMEDQLKPFVHYIPLADDFSDAEERFDWAVAHETECMEISRNASQYMSRFLDSRKEILIECEVLKRYLDNITLC